MNGKGLVAAFPCSQAPEPWSKGGGWLRVEGGGKPASSGGSGCCYQQTLFHPYILIFIHLSAYIYVYIYIYMYMLVNLFIFVYLIYIYICIYIYIYLFIYVKMTTKNHTNNVAHCVRPPRASPDFF